ncbi:MAG TPA: hypothetical protein PLI44_00135 [Chiayiivirga sp.]|uniref:Metal ABC transporter ATP-binding protein n=1 Tax=Denitratimonas tolerans TaxID=1338420 RepID=A0AAW9R5Z3_9GAMM|nr:hypothetical protein [Chiayiivirga sp.]HRO87966.1 hypothetical protein [Chiayiivirga sp.]HRQ34649.1 hypothetical protein [Chiayiivirga sp.]
MKTTLALMSCIVMLAGCASSSKEIKAAYVSPMTYDGYNCQQLREENQRIQSRIGEVTGIVDKRASGDKTKMGVGLILFWPTLFFLKGDGVEAQELSRLKGEHEALEQAYIKKSCSSEAEVG